MSIARALYCPVTEIRSVFLFERLKQGEGFTAYSPPGHLLHLILDGEVEQRCNGREYQLRRGDLLWYHDNELVEGVCRKAPWHFYSVVFHAPHLPPPLLTERRSRSNGVQVFKIFRNLYETWHKETIGSVNCAIRCHAALLHLLLLHSPEIAQEERLLTHQNWLIDLWWKIEGTARNNLARRYSLEDLAEIGRVSCATAHRASMAAVGVSPVRRIKNLRLELVKGLLQYSLLTVTEIAEKTGYERIHELCRDVSRAFGMPPLQLRNAKVE